MHLNDRAKSYLKYLKLELHHQKGERIYVQTGIMASASSPYLHTKFI